MSSEDKIDDGLDNIDWHVDMVFYDGIMQLANNVESRNDYIFTDEITLKDKLEDLDELLEWGEEKEMYTECQAILEIKKEIIANQ
jgi:hypothetical protein|tara:strand:- start:260 stop:514 length:255 start_codon:yes stop_codon:yes gene_type:complete